MTPPAASNPGISEAAAPAVAARGLAHTYPGRRSRPPRRGLDGVSFEVAPGALFGFLGPNGGGKTTLFRILSTLLPVSGGGATVAGHDLAAEPLAVRRALGVAFQSPALDLRLTVEENLRHGGHLYGLSGGELTERIDRNLARFSVADRRHDRAEELSGGLRRRVELAKALLHRPRVLLLDEPSTGLDPRARRELWDVLAELAAGGVTVLLTTHFIEEAERCHRLLLLDRGRVVAEGAPEELKREVGGEVVTLATADPEGLLADLEAAGQATPGVSAMAASEAGVRLEMTAGGGETGSAETGAMAPAAWDLVGRLARSLPGWEQRVTAVTVARPTLEDVFLHRTGRPLEAGDGDTVDEAGAAGEVA